MSLCIHPKCSNPQNPDNSPFCLACGSELLLEGRYRVTSILGGGGFGKTFAVSDARSNTTKVLKVLIDEHPKAVELFQREAEVLARLNHPSIPQVDTDGYFTFFPRNSQEPLHCLVMEKIEGLDLEQYLRQRGDGSTPTQPATVPRVPPTQPVTHQPPVSSQIAPNFGASPLVAQVSSSPGKKTNVALIIGLGCFLPLVGLFLVIAAIVSPLLLNSTGRVKQPEPKQYVGIMNRVQQAYFLEYNKFASTISELQLGIKPETPNYSYSVNVVNPKQSVLLTAKAKVSGLKSYTGAVFVQNAKESLTIAGTCETIAPSQTPPNMPELVKGTIQCPAGSQSLAR
ncbi:serine/threonine protein kinase [Cylindrospermum sp. NIES-4074]|nr:serine/threonine protein kinase [Cylindrospermum sp. NIES-4074]